MQAYLSECVFTPALCSRSGHQEGDLLKEAFNRAGDFFQRAQAIGGGLVFISACLLAFATWVTNTATVAVRAVLFFWLSISLLIVLIIAGLYIVRLQRQLKAERFQRQVQNELVSSNVLIRRLLKPVPGRPSPRNLRSQAIQQVLHACNEIIAVKQKRLAYLAYDKSSRHFKVLSHIGLSDESESRVRRHLTPERGLAGKALRNPCEAWYVPNCAAEDAKGQDYINLGPGSSHGSMVCVGVEVDGEPVGVLCADSTVKKAFSPNERDALKQFALQIGVCYSTFPK